MLIGSSSVIPSATPTMVEEELLLRVEYVTRKDQEGGHVDPILV